VGDGRLSGGLAGVAGVGLTFVLGGAVFLAVRRRGAGQRSATDATDATDAADTPADAADVAD
jgi:hypothetical protein